LSTNLLLNVIFLLLIIEVREMKRARDYNTISELQLAIEEIASRKGNELKKVKEIIDLGGPPTPLNDTKALQFTNQPLLWQQLKQKEDFWIRIGNLLNLPNYFAVDQENRSTFGLQQIDRVIGTPWLFQLQDLIGEFDNLSDEDRRRLARSNFVSYMKWYDDEASIPFLIVYANYLNLTQGLVPITTTRQHMKAPRPLFKETTVPSKTIPIVVEKKEPPPLDFVKEEHFYINTTMRIVTANTSHQYFFSMEKERPGKPETREFRIRLEQEVRSVPTKGLIFRVLKFVSYYELYVVLLGPSDSTLLRISYSKPGIEFTTDFDFPRLNPDLYDDITYYSVARPTRFVTNKKSVTSLSELTLFDIETLSGLKARKAVFKDLNAAQKRQLIRQDRERLNEVKRPLTDEEVVALRQIRGDRPIPSTLLFEDLTTQEKEEVRKATGFIVLDNLMITYPNLEIPIIAPLAPVFKPFASQERYETDDLEVLACKVIRVPQESLLNVFTLAILARKYMLQGTALKLYLFQYRKGTTDFLANQVREFDVPDFLLPPQRTQTGVLIWRPITEMNIIFHNTEYFYIEVMQQSWTKGQYIMESSEIFQFDFRYSFGLPRSDITPQTSIKNCPIVNALARNGYKIYDFRHDDVPGYTRKFDALYYKYDYGQKRARIILYKEREERAGIADLYVNGLSPRRIVAITPLRSANNLCFLQIKESKETTQLFKIIGKETLLSYDEKEFSLAASLNKTLTLASNGMEEEAASFCVFCGDYTASRDTLSGHYYCDHLCQLLFCTTNRL